MRAQGEGGGKPPGPAAGVPLHGFASLDRNGDGTIDREEFVQGADGNHDKHVDRAEFEQLLETAKAGAPRAASPAAAPRTAPPDAGESRDTMRVVREVQAAVDREVGQLVPCGASEAEGGNRGGGGASSLTPPPREDGPRTPPLRSGFDALSRLSRGDGDGAARTLRGEAASDEPRLSAAEAGRLNAHECPLPVSWRFLEGKVPLWRAKRRCARSRSPPARGMATSRVRPAACQQP